MRSVVPEPEATSHRASSETLLVVGMRRPRRQEYAKGDGVPRVMQKGCAASGPWHKAKQHFFPLIFDYPVLLFLVSSQDFPLCKSSLPENPAFKWQALAA